MTDKTTILGISVAIAAVTVLFSLSPVANADPPTYPGLASAHQVDNGDGTSDFIVNAKGKIPTDGSSGAFGYGIITGFDTDGNPENVLALTTHLCAADSLEQGNADDETCENTVGVLEALGLGIDTEHDDATFHAHVLDLKPAGPACMDKGDNITTEVDVAGSLGQNISPGWAVVTGMNKVAVFDVPVDDNLEGSEILGAVDFGIVPIANEDDVITNLCLT